MHLDDGEALEEHFAQVGRLLLLALGLARLSIDCGGGRSVGGRPSVSEGTSWPAEQAAAERRAVAPSQQRMEALTQSGSCRQLAS